MAEKKLGTFEEKINAFLKYFELEHLSHHVHAARNQFIRSSFPLLSVQIVARRRPVLTSHR
jgi:hypothetical protein